MAPQIREVAREINFESQISHLMQQGEDRTFELPLLEAEHSWALRNASYMERLLHDIAKSDNHDKANIARAILDSFFNPTVYVKLGDQIYLKDRFVVENRMADGHVYDLLHRTWVKRLITSPLGDQRMIFDRVGCVFRRRTMIDDMRNNNWEKKTIKAGMKRKWEEDSSEGDDVDSGDESEGEPADDENDEEGEGISDDDDDDEDDEEEC